MWYIIKAPQMRRKNILKKIEKFFKKVLTNQNVCGIIIKSLAESKFKQSDNLVFEKWTAYMRFSLNENLSSKLYIK